MKAIRFAAAIGIFALGLGAALKFSSRRSSSRHLNDATIAAIAQNVPRKVRVSVRSVADPEADLFANEIVAYMEANGWSVGRLSGGDGPGLPAIIEPLQFRPTMFPIQGIEVGVGFQR